MAVQDGESGYGDILEPRRQLRYRPGSHLTAPSTASCLALAAACTALIVAFMQVPLYVAPIPSENFLLNYHDGLRPRALAGWIGNELGLARAGFRWLLYGCQVAWAALLALTLAADAVASPRRMIVLVGLTFLFVYNTATFLATGIDFGNDSMRDLLLMIATLTLIRMPGSVIPGLLTAACLLLALLAHESAVFPALTLIGFAAYRFGFRRALLAGLPFAIVATAYLWMTRHDVRAGNSTEDYVANLARGFQFLYWSSFNVVGIVIAGGLLWPITLISSILYVHDTTGWARAKRLVVVIFMIAMCFAPLLVAWDTDRFVALMWLPTLIIVLETDLVSRLARMRVGAPIAGSLALLQLGLPPIYVDTHYATPLSCYSFAVLRVLARQDDGSREHLARPLHVWMRAALWQSQEDGAVKIQWKREAEPVQGCFQ